MIYVYHIYVLLIKLDTYFFLGFSVQFVTLVLNSSQNDAIFVNIIISFPGTIALLILSYYAVTRFNLFFRFGKSLA